MIDRGVVLAANPLVYPVVSSIRSFLSVAVVDGGVTTYRTVGLMSGTSLDGVDAALCRIRHSTDASLEAVSVEVEATLADEYEPQFRSVLEECCSTAATPETVTRANVAVARRLARTVNRLLADASVPETAVDLIGSHGQTIWHAPEPESLPGSTGRSRATLQIGDGNVLARETGIDAVTDFRMGDVAAGGHGAPLAPLLDWIQFGERGEDRIVQNLGGIGNCTVLPGDGDADSVRAFDTGPGNMVIDAVVEAVTDGERRYDEDGALAATGTADAELLAELLDDPYFDRKPPKSTGRERFGRDYSRRLLDRARDRELEDVDVVATATALTVESIADAYDRHASISPDRVVLSGGGARNGTLVSMLDGALSCPVETSEAHGIDPEFREAALFALLSALFDAGRPGNLPSVTGADRRVVLGKYAKSPGNRAEDRPPG